MKAESSAQRWPSACKSALDTQQGIHHRRTPGPMLPRMQYQSCKALFPSRWQGKIFNLHPAKDRVEPRGLQGRGHGELHAKPNGAKRRSRSAAAYNMSRACALLSCLSCCLLAAHSMQYCTFRAPCWAAARRSRSVCWVAGQGAEKAISLHLWGMVTLADNSIPFPGLSRGRAIS